MALSAVKLSLRDLAGEGVGAPGPRVCVCLGTAWAEFGVELAFLENMIRRGEKGARPAKFASSVHNALASQVAMAFDWEGENHTFTHDASSIEAALWQSLRILEQGRADRAVVCGVDALTEFLQLRGQLLGMHRVSPGQLSPLAEVQGTAGTIPGEGAAAFVLCRAGRGAGKPLARILEVRSRSAAGGGPAQPDAAAELLREVLAEGEVQTPDLLLIGANGHGALDARYRQALALLGDASGGAGVYRHRTGDYATASALGLHLAVRAISEGAIPPEVGLLQDGSRTGCRTVALLHLSPGGHHSAILLTKAQ